MVPSVVVELDESHPPLHQSTCQQAIVGKGELARGGPVQAVDVFRLLLDLHQLGHARLHPVGQLVGGDATQDLRISDRVEALLVQTLQGIQ